MDQNTEFEFRRRAELERAQESPSTPWSAVPGKALSNLGSSALNFAKGMVQPILNPIDTTVGIGNAIMGANEKAYGMVLPESLMRKIPGYEAHQQAANAIGGFFKDRYGSMEGLKNTLATDPVGALSDASMLLGGAGMAAKGGAMVAAKAPRLAAAANATGDALATASNLTNPLTPVIAASSAVAPYAGKAVANVVGELGTHTGAKSIKDAFNSGNSGDLMFKDNLRGNVPMSQVVDEAKAGLAQMRDNSSAQYVKDKNSWYNNPAMLDFQPIDDAFNKAAGNYYFNGKPTIGKAEQSKIREVADVLDEWKQDPSMNTTAGFDALKKRIDSIYPDNVSDKNAQRVISATRNAVKSTIVSQVPEYAGAMKSYETSMGLQNELERAFSLGNRAAVDTTLRKLQSLSRNGVSTNYGNRLDLMDQMRDATGVDLSPAISGQALSSVMPRGLAGRLGAGATAGASIANPAIAALLALQSPRLMGEAAMATGNSLRFMQRNAPTRNQLQMLYQGGRLPIDDQQY